MEHLVALLEPPQDGDGVLYGGLVHQHRLEPALQRGVLLDVLAVFVQGGGADAMQLAPGQKGLQQVACVHGAVGLAGAHNGVQLVDEQDDLALAFFDLLQHAFEPFLKFAPVFGARHQGAHIQAEDGAVLQVFGYVAPHDALCKPLGDGCFAHAGLADQAGVVFALAGQDAHDVADLLVAADHRVQLLLARQLHQVLAVLFQYVVGVFGVVAGDPLAAPHGGELLQERVLLDAEAAQHLAHRGIRLFDEAEKYVFHAHILVLHGGGAFFGGRKDLVGGLGDVDLIRLAAGTGHMGQGRHLLCGCRGKAARLGPQLLQQLRDEPAFLAGNRGQQVLGLQRLVLVFNGKALGALQSLQGFLGEFVGIHWATPLSSEPT